MCKYLIKKEAKKLYPGNSPSLRSFERDWWGDKRFMTYGIDSQVLKELMMRMIICLLLQITILFITTKELASTIFVFDDQAKLKLMWDNQI